MLCQLDYGYHLSRFINENELVAIRDIREKGVADLDARAKLLMGLGLSVFMLATSSQLSLLLSFLPVSILLLASRIKKVTMIFTIIYFVCLLLNSFVSVETIGTLGGLLGLLLFIVIKLIPMMMMGAWIVVTVKVNDFIASMDQMRMPPSVTISLAVTMRFLPTIKEEVDYIRDTMRMRNIDTSFRGVLFHPLRTMEFILIPLLMRSVRIADEMSAAALTRGLDENQKRSSLWDVHFGWKEIVITSIFLNLLFFIWLLEN